MSQAGGMPRVLLLAIALVLLAGAVSAQVIMRPPGQPRPTPPPSQGQVPRPPGSTDPAGPYSLALRVYVTPLDAARVLAPGQGVNLLVTDATGRRFGRGPFDSTLIQEIPDATYEAVVNPNPRAPVGPRGRTGAGITLRASAEGTYELLVSGTERAQFEYVIQAFDRTGRQQWMHFGAGATEPGAVDRFEVTYSLALDPPIWIAEKRDHAYLTVHAWGATGRRQDLVTHMLLTDPRARRLGDSPPTRAKYREIPRAIYEEGGQTTDTLELEILQPLDGAYTLEVIGTRAGRYDLEIHYSDGQAADSAHLQGIPTVPGAIHRYAFECARGAGRPLRLSGRFAAGGLLSFASPTAASTRVSPSKSMFPVIVFYGTTITADSFKATLNGVDVAGRFHPRAGGHEVVTLPLRPGANELRLSVQGGAAGSEVTTARARLAFEVR